MQNSWPARSARDSSADGFEDPLFRVTLDRLTSHHDLAELRFLAGAGGGRRSTRQIDFPRCLPPLGLVPEGFSVLYQHRSVHRVAVVAAAGPVSVLVETYSQHTLVTASADTVPQLGTVIDAIQRLAPAEADEGHLVRMALWQRGGPSCPPKSSVRLIAAQAWHATRGNYPEGTRRSLEELVSLERPGGTGRLVLWHGEPGTGKTTAVLALARAWAPWCTTHVITDPERMFEDSEYLLTVLTHEDGRRDAIPMDGDPPDPERRNWKLVVAEDADEYLRSDARRRSGPALGRLLNATDGILGRGLNTVVLLTTNDEIGRLHPAVTRPGRCLARVEFSRFTAGEAAAWLGHGAAPAPEGATLAELFESLRPATIGVRAEAPLRTGTYL